jgi:hypothetical protein
VSNNGTSKAGKVIASLLIVLGVFGFIAELVRGDARHAWTALQVNFVFWFALAAAASCFPAVFYLCAARWSRPVERICAAMCPFFLCLPWVLVVLWYGRQDLFVWATEPVPGKELWLNPSFVYTRDIAACLLLAVFAYKLNYYSLRKETQEVDAQLSLLSPLVVAAYALVMSLIAWDQIMSVDPRWYSAVFGVFYLVGAAYLALAFCCTSAAIMQSAGTVFSKTITGKTLDDLGKLLFGFGLLWVYLFWSHYLPIWYGNMPGETEWVIIRLHDQPWQSIAWVVLGASFVVPFFVGLSRSARRLPLLLFATGLIVAAGLWLEHYLLFAPTLYPHELPLGLVDLYITLGFLGVAMTTVFLKAGEVRLPSKQA